MNLIDAKLIALQLEIMKNELDLMNFHGQFSEYSPGRILNSR
jgi:hypothetical protein